MSIINVELNFSPKQISQLDEIARKQQITLAETLQLIVTQWLEQQSQLFLARSKMRTLGQGLDAGSPPHNVAQKHDDRLLTIL